MVKYIKKQYPEFTLGVGTVLSKDQVDAVEKLEVDFLVSPGFNFRTCKYIKAKGLNYLPGVETASEIGQWPLRKALNI